MTVQRAIHLLYPDTDQWGFTLNDENDQDRKLFQNFIWTLRNPESTGPQATMKRIGMRSVVVAFQPPWILSEQDLKEFSECRSVRDLGPYF